jgi:endonuclease G
MTFLFSILTLFFAVSPITDEYLPIDDGERINHTYYSLSYNEDTEQANWVYYKLTEDMLSGDAERNNNFRYDPLVTTKSASTKDYTKSGYDRGHLCPAGDRKFNKDAMYESFYMSNVSPQLPGFNRGIWKSLESQVRNWTRDKDSLYVVTGPIFNETDQRIGKNKVRIPSAFYKVLYAEGKNQMLAFILPNQASS